MPYEILSEGNFRRFVRKDGWEYTERNRSNEVVVMIPMTNDGKLIFVEQFRIPIQKQNIEFPAGLVNDLDSNQHESLEETARRELIEETGYQAKSMKWLMRGPANAALATDMLTIYFATGLTKVGTGGGDATENILVHEVPVDRAEAWLQEQNELGKCVDPKVYAALYYVQKLL